MSRQTDYVYDGSDHVVLMKAYMPGQNPQQTAFDYGMNASNTQGVFSNERLYAIRYADPADGTPWLTGAGIGGGERGSTHRPLRGGKGDILNFLESPGHAR